MEFREAIMRRYATKQFAGRPIPDDLISQLLEIVRWAPSGLNIQPWRIKIVTDPHLKEQLSAAAWDEPQIMSCSHLLIFCADTDYAGLVERLLPAREDLYDREGHLRRDGRHAPRPLAGLRAEQRLHGCLLRAPGSEGPRFRLLSDDSLQTGRVRTHPEASAPSRPHHPVPGRVCGGRAASEMALPERRSPPAMTRTA
jgi:hypothetical protein